MEIKNQEEDRSGESKRIKLSPLTDQMNDSSRGEPDRDEDRDELRQPEGRGVKDGSGEGATGNKTIEMVSFAPSPPPNF